MVVKTYETRFSNGNMDLKYQYYTNGMILHRRHGLSESYHHRGDIHYKGFIKHGTKIGLIRE